jgi:NAD(P)-dependent dehydrogenase (short-subunit alcohol dehydrogenase family)
VNLSGSVAVVTGGASGLGRATASALCDAGATVVALDRAAPADGSPLDPDLHFVTADVRSDSDMRAAIDFAAGLGELRVAISCAGVGASGRIARDGVAMDLAEFQQTIDVNLVGTFNLLRLAAACMQGYDLCDGERGVLITTASIAAFDGQVGQSAYSASKGGVVGMTLPIARDLAASQIRCVSVAPGLFDTPLLASLPEPARVALEANVPHPSRLGDPEEFAALLLHVARNPMLNGETIRIDGALRMAPR